MVFVDDVLLGQVLWNLLENAAKYTPPGTPLDLAASEQAGSVIIEVRDRGPGVPAGEEERIFEKFYRGKSEGVRGAGLGLPICRAIVEAHRGTIQALAREGGGTTFRISLPCESKVSSA
jgi:two-component system sensor histidine kinase KdpD